MNPKNTEEQHATTLLPDVVWYAIVGLVLLFVVLALWFKHDDLQSFTDSALWWIVHLLIFAGVVGLMKLGYMGYEHYHDATLKKHERKSVSLKVERQKLQNEQLRQQIEVTRQIPAILKYAMEQGHNVEVSPRLEVKVTNYLSNVHTLPELPMRDEPLGLAEPVKSFAQLLNEGAVQNAIREEKMLLGYTQGVLTHGSWLDLYSCGIGGVSGSGKTTTVRFLLFQAALSGARFVMIDPHIEDKEESLAAQFTCFMNVHLFKPCGDSPSQILQRVRALKKELAQRKHKGEKAPFVILVIDEFNAVMRDKQVRAEVAEMLVSIAQEGRKFGLFAMLIGQRWSQHDIGGADIRTSLASTLAHRFTDENQASLLVGGRAASKCLDLPKGHYWFRNTNGELHEMITPLTVVEDGIYIQRLLSGTHENTVESTAPSEFSGRKTGLIETPQPRLLHPENTIFLPFQESENTDITDLARRVMLLQAEGMQKPDIMRRVWNVNPGGSEDYKKAVQQYQQVMQFIAERLGA